MAVPEFRNDDQLFDSQFHLILIRLHNKLIDQMGLEESIEHPFPVRKTIGLGNLL